ncbi:MAG: hypothetical protein ORN98_10440 [Alphaproteobacteria bacterium]|nr:hypothetical protein [Alphaproteobacteria bacterium]
MMFRLRHCPPLAVGQSSTNERDVPIASLPAAALFFCAQSPSQPESCGE